MDADQLKRDYILGNHFLGEKKARLVRACAGNPDKLATVQTLTDSSEEVIAIDYDVGRFEAQLAALASDDSEKAKALKAWLTETSARLTSRRSVLLETVKACEDKL